MVVTSGWHECGTTFESVTTVSSGPEEKSATEPLQETGEAVPCGDGPEGLSSARVETSAVHQWVGKVEGGTVMLLIVMQDKMSWRL